MAITGMKGRVRVGATPTAVAEVNNWNLDAEVEMLESTNLGDDGKTYVPGLFGASGTIEVNFNNADTAGQVALQSAFFAKTTIAVNLDTDKSGSTGVYTGTAYINKLGIKNEAGAIVTRSFDFQFTGAVTFA